MAFVAAFVPYRKGADGWEFFLQMRDGKAPTNPNIFSTFGGHLEEGEASRDGVLREIREELDYAPANLRFLGEDTFMGKPLDAYVEEVGEDFESLVTVLEGEYGAFLTADKISSQKNVSDHAKRIVAHLYSTLIDR